MKIKPPFNNGRDPEIRETDLAEPMKPEAWLWSRQPAYNFTPEMIAAAKNLPLSTAKDRYGWRGMSNGNRMLNGGKS